MRDLLNNRHLTNILLFLLALNVVVVGVAAFVKWDTYALSPDGQHIKRIYAVRAGEHLLGYTPSREEAEEAVKDIINEYVGDMVLTDGKTNLDIQYEKLKFGKHLQTQDGQEIALYVVEETRMNGCSYLLAADSEEEDASKKVLKGLEEEGAAVYRSSVNGTIVISGNGAEDYQVTTEKQ